MDPREMDMLIQRLVANPHDEEALAYAHRAGTHDPRSYAILLEKVGQQTTSPAFAAHWLSEAANVWVAMGDAHHAARTLMIAVDKDPTHPTAADRLAQLYRDKGDVKALVALLERLAKAITPLIAERPEVKAQLMALYEELGRLWGDPPLSRPERAVENWRRLAELDPQNAYAIYAARELLKSLGQYAEAVPYFAMELALDIDAERRLALYRDEVEVRKSAGDVAGASQALRIAASLSPDDAALQQEYGVAILDRIDAGDTSVTQEERGEVAQLFVTMAEAYDGEYGLAYSTSALKASPGNDRAMQLADFYAGNLNRQGELLQQYEAYLAANPGGYMAEAVAAKAPRKATGPQPPAPPPPPPVAPAQAQPSLGDRPSQPKASPVAAQPAPPPAAEAQPPADSAGAAQPQSGVSPLASSQVQSEPPVAAFQAPDGGALEQLLNAARADAGRGNKPHALTKYREALKVDHANPEALAWVEEYLRQKRMYADLRDVLLDASRVPSVSVETRKAQLRDVAGICESQLKDIETAVLAWKQVVQVDRGDHQAHEQLRRLLEKSQRWDDLVLMLEQEAMGTPEVEGKLAIEKKLAALHEAKREDAVAAAETWARIAGLAPDDESAVANAVRLFEKAERFAAAAQFIADVIGSMDKPETRVTLFEKLGDLRQRLGDFGGAGDAYVEAGDISRKQRFSELAEKAYCEAGRFADAANLVDRRAEFAEGAERAKLLVLVADHFLKAGDTEAAIAKLEAASEIDPLSDSTATALEAQYRANSREPDLVRFLLARAEKLPSPAARVLARRTAAELQTGLGDKEGARESLLLVLKDGDEADTLEKLSEDAVSRGEFSQAVDFIRRLAALTTEPSARLRLAMREAEILADSLGDAPAAIERYEWVLRDLDGKNRDALGAIARLCEVREDWAGLASSLERQLPLVGGEEKSAIAQQLAHLYEERLNDPKRAIAALDILHEAEPDDLDAVSRLLKLCEAVEDWTRVAALLWALIEVEGDEQEASRMTLRLADVQAEKLGRGDEALAALERFADQGDQPCRDAYVALGDKLGWKGIVASKLVTWNESSGGPGRIQALRSAFHRFLEIGREDDAVKVGIDIVRSRGADTDLAKQLEELATRRKDIETLSVAHDVLVKDLSGDVRAGEFVRQAECRVAAGFDPLEAIQHGEMALTGLSAADVEPLLERLAALAPAPGNVVDLYERQVGRCRVPADRLAALARAAQVAATRGGNDRARGFFELALSGGVQEETLIALEAAAKAGDAQSGGAQLTAVLADALASGGQGSRDGGRTRAVLLRRAALMAQRDLQDLDKAYGWLGDALLAQVDDATLDALEALGGETADHVRVDATLTRALSEVFDGPFVRKLLQRRARLRRDVLGDPKAAAVDLKKLHDLSPSDQEVMNDLSALLQSLGDHRGMIQVYEDQILRGRDPIQRAELARTVARIWEEELSDAREAADAWRRVLRMKAGDSDATAGLERAKTGRLRRPGARGSGEASGVIAGPPGEPSSKPRTVPPPSASRSPSASPPKPDVVEADTNNVDEPATERPPAPAPTAAAIAPAQEEQAGEALPLAIEPALGASGAGDDDVEEVNESELYAEEPKNSPT